MITEMTQIIIASIGLILTGITIHFFKFRKKEKPKVGIKRENFSEYFSDYKEIKLYWTSIFFIIVGLCVLITIGILELF